MFRSSHCLHTLLPTSKLLILSSATLELALICLTAVINFTNSHLSTDVAFATATDVLFCGTYMLFDLIWCIIFYPHNWMAFVRLNKRHVMLCYINRCKVGDVIIPQTGTKLTKKRGSKFGALLWRHLTPKRKRNIGAQLQSILHTKVQKRFRKIYFLYDFWCAQTCSFRAVFGLTMRILTIAVCAI